LNKEILPLLTQDDLIENCEQKSELKMKGHKGQEEGK